jgi:transcriptional regulator with XRE-family HTH domain
MSDRNWTDYKLAIEARLSHSTLANIFKRNTIPSIPTLNSICIAFGITLAQFFQEGNLFVLSDEQAEMFTQWLTLSPEQKRILCDLIRNMKHINDGV